jgi:hypothetical protein
MYHIIKGLAGPQVTYRMALLDANVIKELNDLYRFGFDGIHNPEEVNRLKWLLGQRLRFMEMFGPYGAIELGQPHTSAYSEAHVNVMYSNAMYILGLGDSERRSVLGGSGPSELRSARAKRSYVSIGNLFDSSLPHFLADIGLMSLGWDLAERGTPWKLAIERIQTACQQQLRFVPGLATTMALVLAVGTTDDARKMHGQIKFGRSLSVQQRQKRIRSAAWGYTLNRRLSPNAYTIADSNWREPGVYMRAYCGQESCGNESSSHQRYGSRSPW